MPARAGNAEINMAYSHQPLTFDQWKQLEQSGQLSYHYLGAGQTVHTARPDEIIAWHDTCWSGGGVNVVYGDGHADWVIHEQGNALLPLLQKATSPVRNPVVATPVSP